MTDTKTVTNFYPTEKPEDVQACLDRLILSELATKEGNRYTIKVTPPNVTYGIYTIIWNVVDGVEGVNINLDEIPVPNPSNQKAENSLNCLIAIHRVNSRREAGLDEACHLPVVATVIEGDNKITLRSNGDLTITGPTTQRLVKMSAEDTARCNELMSRILSATYPQ